MKYIISKIHASLHCGENCIIDFVPRQKWEIIKVGDEYFLRRDCITVVVSKQNIMHIFKMTEKDLEEL